MKQIEGDEIEVMLAPCDGTAKRLEIGQPGFVRDDYLPSMMALSTLRAPTALARSRYFHVQAVRGG
ncbi:hypothetical protein [Mesorhizobium sp. ArgA1]